MADRDTERDRDDTQNNDDDNENKNENEDGNGKNLESEQQAVLQELKLQEENLDGEGDDDEGDGGEFGRLGEVPSMEALSQRSDVTVPELLGYIEQHEQNAEILRAKIVRLRQKKKETMKKHRGSVIDLHNRMFNKLIETENEQKTELQRAQDRIAELEIELEKKAAMQPPSGDDAEQFNRAQLEKYIDDNARLEKQVSELEAQLKEHDQTLQVEKMKNERASDSHRKSISILHTNMFKKLLDAEDDFEDKIEKLQEEIRQRDALLALEKQKNDHADRLRRDSIQTVHNNMLSKLLDAQAQHDELIERLQHENRNLRSDLNTQKGELRKEVLRNHAVLEKHADREERAGDGDGGDSDVSDLEQETPEEANHQKKQPTTTNANNNKFDDLWDEADAPEAEVDRLKAYCGKLESELKDEKEKPEEATNDDNANNNKFDDLWDEADAPEAEVDRLKAYCGKLESELKDEKEKSAHNEKQRKDSIHNLHNNMFQKLLDAEFEYEEEIERLHREKEELNEKVRFYEDAFHKMNGKTAAGAGSDKEDGDADADADDDGNGSGGAMFNPMQLMELKTSVKEKDEVIEAKQQEITHLTSKLEKLEVELVNQEKQRRGSVAILSQQMMAKLLDAESENEQQRSAFKGKLQQLEKQLEDSQEQAFSAEKQRRNSVTQVSQTMFSRLLQAEQNKKRITEEYEAKLMQLEQKLSAEQLHNETVISQQTVKEAEAEKYKSKATQLEHKVIALKKETTSSERQRRESLGAMQNEYWRKLIKTEDDHKEQIQSLKNEIVRLQEKVQRVSAEKCNVLVESNKQMNDLRRAIVVMQSKKSTSWF
eukprot:CAMPEP_0202726078 /NCGR_PEP_ID=MMETSP1385-20130828/184428_1 /ASSEMBLY_ACC=CAM_ASM_000861 /TAXON_ID=933848 /ORGANISM="Elphidium margaritaceum" /LENGTH=826 /DNA_ID=CAMNT_0049392291 /DNA_START=35 /DNA_END=2516 /DNA_ORIENTATION=-